MSKIVLNLPSYSFVCRHFFVLLFYFERQMTIIKLMMLLECQRIVNNFGIKMHIENGIVWIVLPFATKTTLSKRRISCGALILNSSWCSLKMNVCFWLKNPISRCSAILKNQAHRMNFGQICLGKTLQLKRQLKCIKKSQQQKIVPRNGLCRELSNTKVFLKRFRSKNSERIRRNPWNCLCSTNFPVILILFFVSKPFS